MDKQEEERRGRFMVLENKFVVIEFVKFSYKTWESLE